MTVLTWVSGTTGNLGTAGSWSPAQIPTADDDLVFGASSTGTLTIDGTSGSPNLCRSIDFTGFIGTFHSGAGSKQINIGTSTAGVFTFSTGMTLTLNSATVLNFISTATGNNITTAGKDFGLVINFNGIGGSWILQDTLNTIATNAYITLTNGTLNTNNQILGNNGIGISFNSSNSNTRSLILGTSTLNLYAINSLGWDITNSTGMTLSAGSSTINVINEPGVPVVSLGSLTYGTFINTLVNGAGFTILGSNTFTNLTLTGATQALSVAFGGNQTVGTFTANGNNLSSRMLISSNIIGTPITITAATIGTCSYIDFIDIIGAGVGNWNLASITGGVGDGGGNSGITFNTPKNCYMKTAINSAWTANGSWMTTSGGSTPIVPGVPLLQDTAIFDVNSITTTGKTITLDSYGICNVNFTGVANSPAITYIHQVIFYGSVTLVSGMIHTGAFGVSLSGRGSPTFDGGTLTWPASSTITVNTAPTSTYSLSRNLISSSPIVATSGGLNGNGYTMSFTTCTVNGGKLTLGGLLTLTSTLALSAGTLDMNGSGITGLTTTTISGTGLLKLSGQVNNSGAISVTGGSISNTGGSGELKGTTGSFSGGTSVVEKLTLSSTLALSSTGSLTIDNNGSASYSAMPTMTGASCRLITSQGATFTNTSIAVAADSDIDSGGGGGSSTFGS